MNINSIMKVVRERLVDEIVKELLDERFVIVSVCYRNVDGKRVRKWKAHQRKRKRLRQYAPSTFSFSSDWLEPYDMTF